MKRIIFDLTVSPNEAPSNDSKEHRFLDVIASSSSFLEITHNRTQSCSFCTFDNNEQSDICEICGNRLLNSRNDHKFIQQPDVTETLLQLNPLFITPADPAYTSGLLEALNNKLLRQNQLQFVLCSPYCHHITQAPVVGSVDAHSHRWSCGYRNIQMIATSLMQHPEYFGKLFAGDGVIPNVVGIQRWIERAWDAGFDEMVPTCLTLQEQLFWLFLIIMFHLFRERINSEES
jgi:hypothetical protein